VLQRNSYPRPGLAREDSVEILRRPPFLKSACLKLGAHRSNKAFGIAHSLILSVPRRDIRRSPQHTEQLK